MKVVDIVEMNKHDKQAIYEAYSIEVGVRKALNKEVNSLRRDRLMLMRGVESWQDAWLDHIVRNCMKVVGDVDKSLEEYFEHPRRHMYIAANKSFYAYTYERDCIFIWFSWHRREDRKEMAQMIRNLHAIGLPIRYVGVDNVMRNHSVEISPGLWELRL